MRKGILMFFAPVVIVFLAASVSAQTNDNLLVNGDFAADQQLNGWDFEPFFVQWSQHDIDNDPSSGSANILNSTNDGSIVVVEQCVALPGPGPYDVGASFYLPSGEGQRPGGGDIVAWYASGDCSGDPLRTDEFDTPNPPSLDAWTPVLASSVDPPAGSASANAVFGIFKNDDPAGADVVGYVDATSFGLTSISLGVATVNLPAARVGENYFNAVQSTGGVLPYVFALAAGSSMPPGLTLGADGSVTGKPLDEGPFTFEVTVTDGAPHQQASATVSITVLPHPVRVIKAPHETGPAKVTRSS